MMGFEDLYNSVFAVYKIEEKEEKKKIQDVRALNDGRKREKGKQEPKEDNFNA